MEFDVEKTVKYWLEGAEYDLQTTESLFRAKRYPYALFFGHLSIEKLLKALVVKHKREHSPYTHSLSILASILSFEVPQDIRTKLDIFMEYHFEARYPEEQKEFYKKCTKRYTEEGLKEIKEVFEWLKKRL